MVQTSSCAVETETTACVGTADGIAQGDLASAAGSARAAIKADRGSGTATSGTASVAGSEANGRKVHEAGIGHDDKAGSSGKTSGRGGDAGAAAASAIVGTAATVLSLGTSKLVDRDVDQLSTASDPNILSSQLDSLEAARAQAEAQALAAQEQLELNGHGAALTMSTSADERSMVNTGGPGACQHRV